MVAQGTPPDRSHGGVGMGRSDVSSADGSNTILDTCTAVFVRDMKSGGREDVA